MTTEVFYMSEADLQGQSLDSCWVDRDGERLKPGWYWWPCEPGCLPDGDPMGPFETKELAEEDARDPL